MSKKSLNMDFIREIIKSLGKLSLYLNCYATIEEYSPSVLLDSLQNCEEHEELFSYLISNYHGELTLFRKYSLYMIVLNIILVKRESMSSVKEIEQVLREIERFEQDIDNYFFRPEEDDIPLQYVYNPSDPYFRVTVCPSNADKIRIMAESCSRLIYETIDESEDMSEYMSSSTKVGCFMTSFIQDVKQINTEFKSNEGEDALLLHQLKEEDVDRLFEYC